MDASTDTITGIANDFVLGKSKDFISGTSGDEIDISPQSWGQQAADLEESGSRVAEMGEAASGTMTGLPYGVILTPVFHPRYQEITTEFRLVNSTFKEVLSATATAIKDCAADFQETEENIQRGFEKIQTEIENFIGIEATIRRLNPMDHRRELL